MSTIRLLTVFGFLMVFGANCLVQGHPHPSTRAEVCYGVYGCFSDAFPWYSDSRPVTLLPQAPEIIQTRFILYTQRNPDPSSEEVITVGQDLSDTHFESDRPTKFIIHGFTHNPYVHWVQDMIREILRNNKFNVFVVDWQLGAWWPYMQATANARLLGAQLSEFANFLVVSGGLSLENLHFIGHDLGAHVAAYAAQTIPGFPRVSALDPASVFFDVGDITVRLDATDATFVDVIHTNGLPVNDNGLGLSFQVGHVDFYPNGGQNQPNCDDQVRKIMDDLLDASAVRDETIDEYSCSHMRVYELYIESINTLCPFTGFTCGSSGDFHAGRCWDCSAGQCSRLGFYADPSAAKGTLFLETDSQYPYCYYNFNVKTTVSALQGKPAIGLVEMRLQGFSGIIPTQTINEGDDLNAGFQLQYIFETPLEIGDLQAVYVNYEKNAPIFQNDDYDDYLYLYAITVERLNSDFTVKRDFTCPGQVYTDTGDHPFSITNGTCV